MSRDGVAFYLSPALEAAGVPHVFSTRVGGVSPAPFDSLNLGNPSHGDIRDDWGRIHDNYRQLQQAAGFNGRQQRCWVHQVHGGDVAHVQPDVEFRSGCMADAIVGDDPQRILAVRVADCVPILLASLDGHIVAAVHAGWRGVVAQAVPSSVTALCERSGVSSDQLMAAIGPCIGCDAFEVGPEVMREFEQTFGRSAPVRRNSGGKGQVDLREAVRRQLVDSGVGMDRIDISDRCTYRDADEFFSHRRDRGVTGRMAALIAPRA